MKVRAIAPMSYRIRAITLTAKQSGEGHSPAASNGDVQSNIAEDLLRESLEIYAGLPDDRASAERAYESLHARGYGQEDINLVMSDETRKAHFGSTAGAQTELGTKAAEGAGIGAVLRRESPPDDGV